MKLNRLAVVFVGAVLGLWFQSVSFAGAVNLHDTSTSPKPIPSLPHNGRFVQMPLQKSIDPFQLFHDASAGDTELLIQREDGKLWVRLGGSEYIDKQADGPNATKVTVLEFNKESQRYWVQSFYYGAVIYEFIINVDSSAGQAKVFMREAKDRVLSPWKLAAEYGKSQRRLSTLNDSLPMMASIQGQPSAFANPPY